MFKRSLLVGGFAFWMVSVASSAEVSMSEQTFGCILDWPQVRHTRIKHGVINCALRPSSATVISWRTVIRRRTTTQCADRVLPPSGSPCRVSSACR